MSSPLLLSSLSLKSARSIAAGFSGAVRATRTLVTAQKTMAEAQAKKVKQGPILTVDSMNDQMKNMQYAVRGKLVIRASEIEREIAAGAKKPFDKIIYCNIGNPQSVGQSPLTFVREVLALSLAPSLLDNAAAAALFSKDAQQRAREIVKSAGSLGAYSESKGVQLIRRRVAEFIKKRDGFESNPEHIFLTGGASEGVKLILNMLITSKSDGIMIPIPQYPLYSASITLFGGTEVGYYLDESKSWACNKANILASLEESRAKGINVKAIAVINPGNPTGQVLEEKNIRDIVELCEEQNLVLLADEVYQANVYSKDKKFVSFKKIHQQMQSKVQLASFHSVSKGMLGECGLRGGYMEVVNFGADLVDQVYKAVSVNLCSNLPGQVVVEVMVNPPTGDAKALWDKEYEGIKASLAKKAQTVASFLNTLPGMSCNDSEGAMYLFPQVRLSNAAIDAATAQGEVPDVFYCMALLNETGICVVPGSGFRQVEGTWHFRITFLPREEDIKSMLARLGKFHAEFNADPRKFMWGKK